ncbi:hypothetical protein IEO21_05178 [Rhodonia placenta]|uniref:HSF-type DNA-binding domain-containing protein n=1 Tax=Rhodonia placenta TaxID=104341 RepID=A0A8H7U2C1_9APHY|nr:hypothetical protein IEO21_05178 [Postia placenta]
MGPRIGDGNGGTAPAEARGYGRGCDILILMKPGKPVLGTDGTHAEADGLRERYRQGPQNVYLTWSFEDASDWDAEDVEQTAAAGVTAQRVEWVGVVGDLSQQQGHQQWQQASHLMPPAPPHPASAFPSPSAPTSGNPLSEQPYSTYYQQHSQPAAVSAQQTPTLVDTMSADRVVDRSSLSLNLSSLSVTSPSAMSPINPSPHPSTQASTHVSPITPISPSGLHAPSHHHAHHHHHVQQPFGFAAPDHGGMRYDDTHYDYTRRLTSSRSSSSSEKSVPRKRSFGTVPALSTSVEEPAYDQTMDASPYDEVEMSYPGLDAENSPIDGSTSGGEQDDHMKPMEAQIPSSNASTHTGMSMGLLNKPLGTNNFVTKLYQMINDPKSAQFISWTELGTSFVVQNVGEFSRTILGSHFKHNNFSSFVRQLNMYGFHKINRRTSADVQTWEFSHHKFLRGRPDLLEEIKRKALEPDPALKHRVELPGEVAAQLAQAREDNRRLAVAVHAERAKVERLAIVTKAMYDVMSRTWPGSIPMPFPNELLESAGDSPNIYITSPTHGGPHPPFAPPSLSISSSSLHSLHSLSPSSSPTAADFPSHSHTPSSLSRQPSFQHLPGYDGMHHAHAHAHALGHGVSSARYETALSTPLPPSPGLDFGDDGRLGAKRQRTGTATASASEAMVKKGSRARSDSAPLGYGLNTGWAQTRPRSGSGLGPRGGGGGRRDEPPVPNIGSLSRTHTLPAPVLSIPSGPKHSSNVYYHALLLTLQEQNHPFHTCVAPNVLPWSLSRSRRLLLAW